MASRKDLTLEQKINLIKENERGSSYRILKEKFNVSVGNISNILKRKNEYLDEDEFSRVLMMMYQLLIYRIIIPKRFYFLMDFQMNIKI